MNLTKPLFALGYCDKIVPASTPNLADVKSWRPSRTVYTNEVCDRDGCANPHDTVESTYCKSCLALPSCDECGEPKVDCDRDATCPYSDNFEYDECGGCEDGCGICTPSRRVSGHWFDRERFGFDG